MRSGAIQKLTRYAWLSVLAAIATIALKGGAYVLTDSVGLLSDALESVVNLVAALVALRALAVASRPADEEHAYGHTKAEYFSSGFEGGLVLVAALVIAVTAIGRLIDPVPIANVGIGLAISFVASAVNFGVARVLFRAASEFQSIALEADAQHLMTDVWTSAGVLAGVGLVGLTGWTALDPVVALLVAANITRVGVSLVRRSMLGLLDTALPPDVQERIREVLARHERAGIQFHACRTRRSGARRFMSVHVLVPGEWTVQQGHDLLERIEAELREAVPRITVFTHMEPVEDPVAWHDTRLERP
ncbi:MAG: cation diffusion facilitator family transporter [Gemmatimonadota bacterium]